ncbi:MAG: hypothetical protein EBV31_08340 [Verrucomicrobia bacterium]|nr:hypothetical protein [Verrucomicrobiota bacterium]
MAPNPLKPLMKGLFVMLALAGAILLVHLVRVSLLEQEQRRVETQKRYNEENERRNREAEKLQAEARQRREREAEERRAQAAAAAAAPAPAATNAPANPADAKRRIVDLRAAFDKTVHRAASGDPHAQYLLGYLYLVGMDKIVQVRDAKLFIYNRLVVATLTGEDPSDIRLVSVPAFSSDRKVAEKWLERASLQGHRGAQIMLATSLLTDIKGDDAPAYRWLLTSEGPPLIPDEVRFFNPPPASRASMKENVRKRLSPEQVAEAEKMAKEFQPKKETR